MTIQAFLALLAIALCAYRVTRVVTDDTISQSFRAWVWRLAYRTAGYDSLREGTVQVRRSWLGEKAYQLVSCPFCLGWWVTIGVFVAWFGWPRTARDVVRLGAAIGMQAFVSSRRDA